MNEDDVLRGLRVLQQRAQRRRKPTAGQIARFAARARAFQDERDAADSSVPRLLQETRRNEWRTLVSHPALRTMGALATLGRIFAARLTGDPQEARAIAELAVAISEGWSETALTPSVLAEARARAWTHYGMALHALGRSKDAEEAFLAAARKLEGFGVLLHDLAIVKYHMAACLQKMQRFDESLQLLADCRDIFRERGDRRNGLRAALAEDALRLNRLA
jgi:tetratricopeptide (TPR) repeat protein